MTVKWLLWSGLAIAFLALAIFSSLHYRSYRNAVKHVRFRGVDATAEHEKFFDKIMKKSETGLQGALIRSMIPIEIAGFILAAIAAILEIILT